MPDPGVQRGGSDFDASDFDASVESTGVDLNEVAAAISAGPLESLGLNPIAKAVLGAVIPGIGVPDLAHNIAQAIGSGISNVMDAFGLEGTAAAKDTSFSNVPGDEREGADRPENKIIKALGNFNIAQRQSGSLGLASNLSAGTAGGLLPTLSGLDNSLGQTKAVSSGVGDQILKKAGAEKLKEMLSETTGGEGEAKKASPTQQVNKPVEQAQKSREEGRGDFEKMFLEMLTGQLNVQS